MKMFLIALTLMSFVAMAADECAELGKCVEYVSKLTGKKYLYDSKAVKGGLQATSNTTINAENADTLLTYILDMNGYARIPTPEKDTYIIVEARDIRYQAVPTMEVDSQTTPKLPQNNDYYMVTFKFKNFKHDQIRAAANSLRPFMSRYARTIELNVPGTLALQETAIKITKMADIIKGFDRELTKEEIKNYMDRKKHDMEEEKEGRKLKRGKDDKKEEKK